MALPDVDRRHTAHVQAAPPANADWPPPNHIHTHFPPSASHLHSKKKKTTLSPFNHFPLFFYAFYSFLSLIPAYNYCRNDPPALLYDVRRTYIDYYIRFLSIYRFTIPFQFKFDEITWLFSGAMRRIWKIFILTWRHLPNAVEPDQWLEEIGFFVLVQSTSQYIAVSHWSRLQESYILLLLYYLTIYIACYVRNLSTVTLCIGFHSIVLYDAQ